MDHVHLRHQQAGMRFIPFRCLYANFSQFFAYCYTLKGVKALFGLVLLIAYELFLAREG